MLALMLVAVPSASAAVAQGGVAASTASDSAPAVSAARERVTLGRTAGRPGTRVRVSGQRFPDRSSVSIRLGDRRVARTRTDHAGRFTTRFTVPRVKPGRRALVFATSGSRVTRRFRVLTPARVSLTTTSVTIGQRIGVRGRAFPRRAAVGISLDGRRLARTRTSARGRFSLEVRIRATSTGRKTLLVVAGDARVRRRLTVLAPTPAGGPGPSPEPTPSPPPSPGPGPSPAPDPVIAAAGDIACDPGDPDYNGGAGTSSTCRQRYTSDLLINRGFDRILTLGDHQYEDETYSKYLQVFDPTWGRVKNLISPIPGNREYRTAGAAGYFDYFNGVGQQNGAAGERGKGFYSYDVGAWHVIALNSNCAFVSCAVGSPQHNWLESDLAANPRACTLAYFHHPRFTSSSAGNQTSVAPFWQSLFDAGVDVILTSHGHGYERFAPQTPSGAADGARGIRQFVVGTGGRSLHSFTTDAPNSEVRNNTTYGILKMTLRSGSYDWAFVPEVGGSFRDSGSQACH